MTPPKATAAHPLGEAAGWAAMENYVALKIHRARRGLRWLKSNGNDDTRDYLRLHSEIVVLLRLQRNFEHWKQIPPNS